MAMMLIVSGESEKRSKERGAALVSVLLISMLLLAAGGALIMTTAMSATNSIDSTAEAQAFYAAHAGLQATLNVLRGNIAPNPLIDPSSPSAPGNDISFRKAVTASTSNNSGENGPRLSRWLSYDPDYNDRVVLTKPYSPLNGLAYNASISDPDNSSQVTFYTQGAFGSNAPANTASFTYATGGAKVTVSFTGQTSATINGSGSSTLGSFAISVTGINGNNSVTIPTDSTAKFNLTITQTGPWSSQSTIQCTLSGTVTNTSSTLAITFPNTNPANTNSLQGTLFTRTTSTYNLPSGATTTVPVNVTAPEPQRLIVRVNGFGPRAANKQMQMLLSRFIFDYTASSAITLRSADDTTVLSFNAGSSSQYGYNGNDNAGGSNLAAFAVTSSTDCTYVSQSLGISCNGQGNTQVVGTAGVQQVSISSLPTWLQTADAARAMISQMRLAAQNVNRYYTTASQPPDFGTASQPALTFVDGDTDLPPQGGAGLLIVTGTLTLNGSSQFDGLILVMGSGQLIRSGGGNGNSLGSMAIARFGSTGNFLAPTFNSNGSGNSAVQYDSAWVRKALTSTGPRVLGISEN